MAYMSQEHKQKLAPTIKALFKEYGVKGTIGVRHHSTLVVKITSGKLDVERDSTNGRGDLHFHVNEYHIDSNYTGKTREFLLKLKAAMEGPDFFNESDSMTDYFHRSHYIDIHFGNNSPYSFVGEREVEVA